jgi:hypothetical protein
MMVFRKIQECPKERAKEPSPLSAQSPQSFLWAFSVNFVISVAKSFKKPLQLDTLKNPKGIILT